MDGESRRRSVRAHTLLSLAVALGLLGLCVLALAGCGAGSGSSTTASGTTASSATGSGTTSSSPGTTSGGAALRATTVVQGLRVPWEMRFLPDGRLLVTERGGRVVVADLDSGVVGEVGTVDVLARGEGGLMGMALDPEFSQRPYLYLSFTHDQEGERANRVSRFEVLGYDPQAGDGGPAAGGAAADADNAGVGRLSLGSETVLIDGIPAGSNHDGSRVAFGPDGYLWITTGDAGDGDLAQRMDSLAGKVLRMDRDGRPDPDGPFSDRPYPFSLIYTLGHRNPQGLAFGPESGQAYVTEHGPSDNDEVNSLRAGGNYGWPDLRGAADEPGFDDPIMTWTPTIAPAGALFYTGDLLRELQGTFLFVTLKERDLRVLVPSGDGDLDGVAEERVLFDREFGRLRAIAQGPDGALYLSTSNHDGRGDAAEGDDRIIRVDNG